MLDEDLLRRTSASHSISAIEIEYSLFTSDIEYGLSKAGRELHQGHYIRNESRHWPLRESIVPEGTRLPLNHPQKSPGFENSYFHGYIPRQSKESSPNVLELMGGLKEIGWYNTSADLAI